METVRSQAQSPRTLEMLASDGLAILIDNVEIDPDGTVRRSPRQRFSFRFDFEGATFTAEARPDRGDWIIDLTAELGPLPYSAESLAARTAIQALVAARAGSSGLHIDLDDAINLVIRGNVVVPQPVTPVALLTSITEALLELRPSLRRLAELLASATPSNHRTI
ncbi:MAG TPA: hypothetical protein VF342_10010 [Alphaproteobacteria bacterium]